MEYVQCLPVHPRGRYCGRRADVLYGVGELFACQRCYGLSYASQQQTALHRGLGQARKIRMRLGGGVDLLRRAIAGVIAAGGVISTSLVAEVFE